MIAACPTCGARYRIDTAKLRPEGARLRCSRCESVFRVRAPGGAEERAEAPQAPAAAAAPPAAAAQAPRPSGSGAPSAPEPKAASFDRERLVLVAHPETESGKAVADALAGWGLQTILVHDGVEAILNIQRALPRVVVLDAALPKMFGFQVCELMKRNESLRNIHVILVGAIHAQERYRRPPNELYGADEYVERQELPEALGPLLQRFGMPLTGAPATPAPMPRPSAPPAQASEAPVAPPPAARPRPAAPPAPTAPPQPAAPPAPTAPPQPAAPPAPPPAAVQAPARPEAAAPADPALADEIQQADRLARIIVSDIVLYNPERFEEGLRTGNVLQALEAELEEGRSLLAQRVDPRVGAPEAFLRRELLRVARTRGMSE